MFHPRAARVVLTALAFLGPLVCLALGTKPALAQWVEGGVPVARGNNQLFAQVADGSGGSIIVWSAWQGDYDWGIRAQRLTAAGTLDANWPIDGVPLCSAAGAQLFPSAVQDGFGGAFAVWLDNRGRDPFAPHAIYAHRVNVDGSVAAGWLLDGLAVCPDSCTEVEPVIAADGAGGAYIGWSELGPTGNVRVQHITRDGSIATSWPTEGLVVCDATGAKLIRKAVPDGAGGVYLSWDDSRDGQPEPYVQRVTSEGGVGGGWPVGGLRFGGSGAVAPVGSTMCSDGAGGLIVFWREGRYGNGFTWSMRSKHIASDGSQSVGWTSPEITVGVYSSLETPECESAVDGGAFVAWTFIQSGSLYPLYIQKVLGDGSSAPGWPDQGIPLSSAGYSFRPRVASDGAGGGYFAWENFTGSPEEIQVQHVLSDGSLASGWVPGGLPMGAGNSNAFMPSILATGSGAGIVLWETLDGIYAQKVVSTGVDYFAFAIAGTKVDPDRARLVWQASTAWTGPVTVYRHDENGWNPLRVVAADPSGRVSFEDLDVIPGAHYMYRLGAVVHDTEIFYGEVDVQVPLFALTVRPLAGNPIRQDLEISFTLPMKEAAKVQLFDVHGRLVESREVGQMGLGRHTVTLGSGEHVASGIYVVRLSQGGRTASSKVALLR